MDFIIYYTYFCGPDMGSGFGLVYSICDYVFNYQYDTWIRFKFVKRYDGAIFLAFLILILILLFKPSGLLGSKFVEKV